MPGTILDTATLETNQF